MVRVLPLLRWFLIAAQFVLLVVWWWAKAQGFLSGSLISFAVLCGIGATLCGLYTPEGKLYPQKTKRFILISSGIAIVCAIISIVISALIGLGVLR